MRRLARLAACALLAACAEGGATRGIGPVLGPVAGPGAVPALLGIEREIRDGRVSTTPGGAERPVGRRVAVVIGNSAYQAIGALANPRRDAGAMAGLLKGQGYHVIEGYDLSKQAFEGLLREAVLAGGPDAEILVFYAGHGFQIANRNYLVPVDAAITGPDDLPFQTVRLATLFRILGDRSGSHVSFLDSCRNNPFPAQEAKAGVTPEAAPTEVGFSEPRVPRGGLVAYSTRPGEVAFDGDGANSPFTAALLRHAQSRPDDEITATLRRVRSDVRSATGGRQVPTWVSQLGSAFALKPSGAASRVAEIPPEPPPPAGTPPEPPATPILASAAPGSAPTPTGRPAVTVAAPMEQVVALGSRVSEALDLPPEATVTIAAAPAAAGEVATVGADGALRVEASADVPADQTGAVVYTLPVDQRPAPQRPEAAAITEALTAEVTLPGAAPVVVDVSLVLVPDECDRLAGDWLDLQGIGLYAQGGVAAPGRAVDACEAAVVREPGNGRFHYLLGRAHEADGNGVLALEAYRRASALGHLRAWTALGRLAEARGDRTELILGYYQKGADGGDPLAIERLGIVKLRLARSREEREEAYDLLTYAVDLGLPDAMKALSEYFSDPASPDHDPGRGAAFGEAAAAAEAAGAYGRAPRRAGGAGEFFGGPTVPTGPGTTGGERGGTGEGEGGTGNF